MKTSRVESFLAKKGTSCTALGEAGDGIPQHATALYVRGPKRVASPGWKVTPGRRPRLSATIQRALVPGASRGAHGRPGLPSPLKLFRCCLSNSFTADSTDRTWAPRPRSTRCRGEDLGSQTRGRPAKSKKTLFKPVSALDRDPFEVTFAVRTRQGLSGIAARLGVQGNGLGLRVQAMASFGLATTSARPD